MHVTSPNFPAFSVEQEFNSLLEANTQADDEKYFFNETKGSGC